MTILGWWNLTASFYKRGHVFLSDINFGRHSHLVSGGNSLLRANREETGRNNSRGSCNRAGKFVCEPHHDQPKRGGGRTHAKGGYGSRLARLVAGENVFQFFVYAPACFLRWQIASNFERSLVTCAPIISTPERT